MSIDSHEIAVPPTTGSGVTLLWALRSPCHLRCRYCYFGQEPQGIGTLSHYSSSDLSPSQILQFARSLSREDFRRVVLAGGEPLVWEPTFELAEILKKQGLEVVIATNGIPLAWNDNSARILKMGVDAISVSLDSYDEESNDRWRRDPSGGGWKKVLEGLRTLLRLRSELESRTRIGIYSVVSRANYVDLLQTTQFIADLGVDYHVIQPISLPLDHPLADELSLRPGDIGGLVAQFSLVRAQIRRPLVSTTSAFHDLLVATVALGGGQSTVRSCFGGRSLLFVQPDGSVWPCPSRFRIESEHHESLGSIGTIDGAALLANLKSRYRQLCNCFSDDCVNMWPLMSFDAVLQGASSAWLAMSSGRSAK